MGPKKLASTEESWTMMQIHGSDVNMGFMELSKPTWKAGGKAVGQPECVTWQIMKLLHATGFWL